MTMPIASDPSQDSLRVHDARMSMRSQRRSASIFAALSLAVFASVACSRIDPTQAAALAAGRDAVVPCQERFHEQSRTYADCARYIANRKSASTATATHDWRRLGALTAAWITADRVGQLGDAEANGSARQLVAEATQLQQQMKVADATLYALLGMPRGNFNNRRKDLLDSAPVAP